MKVSHAELIEGLGGVTAVANRLGIKPPSVSGWIEGGKDGIPDGRLIELGAEIDRELGIKRWTLRPLDWHRIWPELVGTPGAPTPRKRAPATSTWAVERPTANAREQKGRA